MLPNVLNSLVEAKVSVDRIHNFLLAAEKDDVGEEGLDSHGVMIRKGTFVWKTGKKKELLYTS